MELYLLIGILFFLAICIFDGLSNNEAFAIIIAVTAIAIWPFYFILGIGLCISNLSRRIKKLLRK